MRDSFDDFATDSWVVEAILPYLPGFGVRSVCDPCCGCGGILRAAETRWMCKCHGIEIQDKYRESYPGITIADALSDTVGWNDPDIIITNPPYRLAQQFVEKSLSERTPGGTVAMLLRLGWLASMRRAAFHIAHPSDVYVLSKRPSFTGDGATDMTEYAWFVWGPGRGHRWFVLSAQPRKGE